MSRRGNLGVSLAGWVFVLLALLCFAPGASAQDGEGPLKLSDVNRMIRADQSPGDVVAAAAERGVAFEFSRSTLRRLEQWGFSEGQVDRLRGIAAGEDPGEAMPDGEGEDAADAGDEDDYPVGYRETDGTHEAEKARIERAIEAAALGYERIELSRVTLYCERRRARGLVEVLQRTERAVIARFPASIVNAMDPRSAHIVVVDGESEWARWLESYQASYEQDGITFPPTPEGDFKTRMANSSGYTNGNLAAVRGELFDGQESLNRSVTYHLGHIMMEMAARPEGYFKRTEHDGLVTGFGDLIETMAMGSPSVMVYSYTERDLAAEGTWAQMVQKRFADGGITTVTDVWTYSTSSMEPEHYAEAWSMVSLLAEAPDKFADAVLRVQREESTMAAAVRAAYGLEDARLLQGWRQYAGR